MRGSGHNPWPSCLPRAGAPSRSPGTWGPDAPSCALLRQNRGHPPTDSDAAAEAGSLQTRSLPFPPAVSSLSGCRLSQCHSFPGDPGAKAAEDVGERLTSTQQDPLAVRTGRRLVTRDNRQLTTVPGKHTHQFVWVPQNHGLHGDPRDEGACRKKGRPLTSTAGFLSLHVSCRARRNEVFCYPFLVDGHWVPGRFPQWGCGLSHIRENHRLAGTQECLPDLLKEEKQRI